MDRKKIYIGAGILGVLILLYLLLRKRKQTTVKYELPANFDLSDTQKGAIQVASSLFVRYFDVSTWEYWTTPGIQTNRLDLVDELNEYRESELIYFLYAVSEKGKDARLLLKDAVWVGATWTEERPESVRFLISKLDNLTQ